MNLLKLNLYISLVPRPFIRFEKLGDKATCMYSHNMQTAHCSAAMWPVGEASYWQLLQLDNAHTHSHTHITHNSERLKVHEDSDDGMVT